MGGGRYEPQKIRDRSGFEIKRKPTALHPTLLAVHRDLGPQPVSSLKSPSIKIPSPH